MPVAVSGETNIAAWYRAQEAGGEHPQDRIEALLERQEWAAAAAACREWLDRDATAAWPMRALAELHERAGHLLTARALAMRAATLHFGQAGEPSVDLEILRHRVEARFRENPALPELASPYAGDLKYLRHASRQEPAMAAAPVPSQVAPAAPTAAPAAVTPKPPPAPRPAATAVVPAKPAATPDLRGEAQYLADPSGQWAASALASSQYGNDRYSAMQASGAPDVARYGDDPKSWCPSSTSGRAEWIEFSYAQPVRVREVRVRQSHMPGTVIKVEGITPDGATHVLWQGPDTQAYAAGQVGWLVVRAATSPRIARVKLTLDLSLKPGWKQIDAVQLVGD